MPRYLLSIYQPDGTAPAPEVLGPIMRDLEEVNAQMKAAGVWVMAAGLAPAAEARVAALKAGTLTVTDGPFVESKEHIGGFTLIEAADFDAAAEWAARLAKAITLPIEVRGLVGG